MIIDGRGIKLLAGDEVILVGVQPYTLATVKEITEGGIVTGMKHGKAEVRPTILTLSLPDVNIPADPTAAQVMQVLKLAPAPKEHLIEN